MSSTLLNLLVLFLVLCHWKRSFNGKARYDVTYFLYLGQPLCYGTYSILIFECMNMPRIPIWLDIGLNYHQPISFV